MTLESTNLRLLSLPMIHGRDSALSPFARRLRLDPTIVMSRRTLAAALLVTLHAAHAQVDPLQATSEPSGVLSGAPIRLRSAPAPAVMNERDATARTSAPAAPSLMQYGPRAEVELPPHQPDDFERYVRRLAGIDESRAGQAAGGALDIRRFGADVLLAGQSMSVPDQTALVPADYLVSPGDELQITLWGSVDADVRTVVDRTGRISLPRVGSFMVAGTRYADLPDVIGRRVGQVFKNFQVSVSLGQLRSVRVYVTGFAKRPGAHYVTSLSTLVNVLARSGGPSSAGSYRKIELRRGGQTVATFDLYDLLIKGDRSADRTVQAEDVIHIGPVGPQVGLIGSVNKPAVFELKPGDTAQDVLAMAGGFTAVADRSRVTLESLSDRDDKRIVQLRWPEDSKRSLESGDVLRAFSQVDARLSAQLQNKRIRVEGEVARPGEYLLPPESTLADALRAAGGLTPLAYVFGSELTRESVRVTQQENYERALRDLEVEFAKAAYTRKALTADEAAAQTAAGSGSSVLIQRLREVKPTGRVVLQLNPAAPELPALALEDGDRLYVPARPNTVGVFGSVFNGGSYLFTQGRNVDDFLKLAGGPTRGADADSVFVLRANGSVVSARQGGGGLFGGSALNNLTAQPGDTIFVPEEVGKTTFVQNAKEWTQILAQFGLGAAAIKTLK